MAVSTVVELCDQRNASATWERQAATRSFLVTCTAASDGPVVALWATGIPRIGDLHPDYATTASSWHPTAESINAVPYGERMTFKVSVEYGTRSGSSTRPPVEQAAQIENPLSRPPVVRYGFQQERRVVERDLDGFTICNLFGEVYDPPYEQAESIPMVTITANYASFDFQTAISYINCLNSDTWSGAVPGTLLMSDIGADNVFENNVYYWRVTYTILNRPIDVIGTGWQPALLNKSTKARTAASLTAHTYQILDGQGLPVTTPVALDAYGREANVAKVANDGSSAPYYKIYRTHETQNFQSLIGFSLT